MLRLLEDMEQPHPGRASLVVSNTPDAAGLAKAEAVPDIGAAAELLRSWLQPGDSILLKASRAARLEQLEDLI